MYRVASILCSFKSSDDSEYAYVCDLVINTSMLARCRQKLGRVIAHQDVSQTETVNVDYTHIITLVDVQSGETVNVNSEQLLKLHKESGIIGAISSKDYLYITIMSERAALLWDSVEYIGDLQLSKNEMLSHECAKWYIGDARFAEDDFDMIDLGYQYKNFTYDKVKEYTKYHTSFIELSVGTVYFSSVKLIDSIDFIMEHRHVFSNFIDFFFTYKDRFVVKGDTIYMPRDTLYGICAMYRFNNKFLLELV